MEKDEMLLRKYIATLVKNHRSYSELEIISLLGYEHKAALQKYENRLSNEGVDDSDITGIEMALVMDAKREHENNRSQGHFGKEKLKA